MWRQTSEHAVRDVGRDRKSFGEHPPSISAVGRLAAGGRFSLTWQYLPDFPAYRETVRVVHGSGTVELVFPSPYLMHAPTELTVTGVDGDAERRVVRRSITEAFETQLEAFYAMIREGIARPHPGSPRDGRTSCSASRSWPRTPSALGIPVGGEVGALIGR